ncbi:very short patch repair endonuclease [Caulobacter sp. S45]|uniref:very short patch repair endonuclease n=1 Tax=Caulobacter sp. S45 TaxID=1641861 RepID=UPI00131C572C|nr:very short patch repair endonuclease [Caulobacter sp. S45]
MDTVPPDVRSRIMSSVRSTNTKPELVVRRLLHSLGYRFRLHRADLPGRPDISFSAKRKVIDVRGCFWHQHPDPRCSKATIPTSRRDWWASKLQTNIDRDNRNALALQEHGWTSLVLWECELTNHDQLRIRLEDFLGPPLVKPRNE